MNGNIANQCPLCELPADYAGMAADLSRMLEVACARCGRYKISDQALEVLPSIEEKHLLSYVCRTRSEPNLPRILTTNLQEMMQRASIQTVPEMSERLIELLAEMTNGPGSVSSFDASRDYTLIPVRSQKVAAWFLDWFASEELLTRTGTNTCALTFRGWERVTELRRAGPNSAFVFVAMSFRGEMTGLFDAATRCAARGVRADSDRPKRTRQLD